MAASSVRPRVACVAVISRENAPLFLRCYAKGVDELRFHYIVHGALDLFDEKMRAAAGVPSDGYLGLLTPTIDFRVYGYVTNTQLKLVAVVIDEEVRENDVRQLLVQLHSLAVDALSNPFQAAGKAITSRRFEKGVQQLVGAST